MDNALNKIIAFLSAVCILIGLLIGSVFLLPVSFAFSDSFDNQPLSLSFDYVVRFSYYFQGTTNYFGVYSDSPNVYIFTDSSSEFGYKFYAVSNISDFRVYIQRFNPSNNSLIGSSSYIQGNPSFDSSTGLYYYTSGNTTGTGSTAYYPFYDSLASGLLAVSNIINGSSISVSLYEGLNIPAGYAAWLELDNNASLDVVTSFEFNNAFLGDFNNTSQWSNINLSATPDFSEVNRVPDSSWLLKFSPYGDKNIFGLTKNGIAHVPTVSGYNLWIVNPLTSVKYNLLNSEVLYNNSLTLVNTVGIKKVRLFAIDATVNSTGGITNTVLTQGGITVDSTTDGGFVYTDSDNNIVSAPSNGGANTYPDSSSNIFSTIERAFNDLISRLERIFNAPAIYFERIVNALSNFGSWLGQLWSWLPAPLSALIEAVIYISILVGLIKLLLR